jgi:hypothetical protein
MAPAPGAMKASVCARSPYSSLDFTNMHERCSRCRQSFDPEPGFYQGAMYVSYAFTLALAFIVSVIMLLFSMPILIGLQVY